MLIIHSTKSLSGNNCLLTMLVKYLQNGDGRPVSLSPTSYEAYVVVRLLSTCSRIKDVKILYSGESVLENSDEKSSMILNEMWC